MKASPNSPQIKVNVEAIDKVSKEAALRPYLAQQYETADSTRHRQNMSKITKYFGYESVVNSPNKVSLPTHTLEELLAGTLQHQK